MPIVPVIAITATGSHLRLGHAIPLPTSSKTAMASSINGTNLEEQDHRHLWMREKNCCGNNRYANAQAS